MTTQHAPDEPAFSGAENVVAESSSDAAASVDVAAVWALTKRLPAYVRLAHGLARDPKVPRTAKVTLAIGGAYVVSPIDLIPGLIPVAGQLDDMYVMLTGLQQAVRLTPNDVVAPHLAAHGLHASSIDDDLAVLRTFVRQSVAWTWHQGGRAVGMARKQTRSLILRARNMRVQPT